MLLLYLLFSGLGVILAHICQFMMSITRLETNISITKNNIIAIFSRDENTWAKYINEGKCVFKYNKKLPLIYLTRRAGFYQFFYSKFPTNYFLSMVLYFNSWKCFTKYYIWTVEKFQVLYIQFMFYVSSQTNCSHL